MIVKKKKALPKPKKRRPIIPEKKPKCSDCGLCKNAKNVKMEAVGSKDSDIMVINDYPGIREDTVNKPFQGRVGEMFYKLMEKADLDPDEMYITHAVKCRPKGIDVPTKAEYKSCLPHLIKEIEEIAPKFVLILGSGVVQPLLGKGFKKNKNCIIEKDGIKYMILDNPSSVLKKPSLEKLMLGNFKRFRKLMSGDLDDGDTLNWHYVDSAEKFKQCIKDLQNEKEVVAYDIETTGLKFYDPKLYLATIGFAIKGKEWVVPFNHPDAPWCGNHELHKKMYHHLIKALKGKICVAHNGKFDNKFLRFRYGYCPVLDHDTMLMSYMIDENEPNDLKNLSKIYCNANDYAVDATMVLKFPMHVVAKYNAFDVHYTRRLYFIFKEMLEKDARTKAIYDNIVMPASKCYEDAEMEGVYLDPIRMTEAIEDNYDTVQKHLNVLKKMFPQVSNWNSNPQINKLLFEDLGLPILERTAKGAPSNSGEKVLPRLVDKHPVVQALLDYREHLKLGQFFAGWKEELDETGRMHPSFLIHGTVTGRPSCKEPNLQQTPRDASIRSLVTAPEGWILVEADYSQAELRIAAMMSGDPVMKMCFQTKIDIHYKTASTVAGVPLDKVTKEMRKKAKAVNFGFVYGMGGKKFKDYARDKYQVDMTQEEAFESRDAFFSTYAGLQPWHERQRRLVHKFGYVRSIIGRKRNLPEIYSRDQGTMAEAERQSINSPVQGFGSDLDVFSLIRIRKEISYEICRPIGTIHDAILVMVKIEHLGKVVPEIVRIMTDNKTVEKTFNCPPITIPIEVEVKAGAWGKGTVIYDDKNGLMMDKIIELKKGVA